jgi:hypothetical protein
MNRPSSNPQGGKQGGQLFGALTPDSVRHAASERVKGFGYARCDHLLNVAWLEPLQPGQKVCKRPACQRAAKEAEAANA